MRPEICKPEVEETGFRVLRRGNKLCGRSLVNINRLSLREVSGYLELDTAVSQSRHMISLAIKPYSSGG